MILFYFFLATALGLEDVDEFVELFRNKKAVS